MSLLITIKSSIVPPSSLHRLLFQVFIGFRPIGAYMPLQQFSYFPPSASATISLIGNNH